MKAGSLSYNCISFAEIIILMLAFFKACKKTKPKRCSSHNQSSFDALQEGQVKKKKELITLIIPKPQKYRGTFISIKGLVKAHPAEYTAKNEALQGLHVSST